MEAAADSNGDTVKAIVEDASTTNNNDEPEGKLQSFRKRRLSLPKHQLGSAAAEAGFYVDTYVEDSAMDPKPPRDSEQEQASVDLPEDDVSEDKAHTFRKRRLSLTSLTSLSQQSQNQGDGSDKKEPETKRQRRLSAAESSIASSTGSTPTNNKSRILHSAEMIAGPFAPPSPIHHHVLHQQNPLPPAQLSALDDDLNDHHHANPQQQALPSQSMEFSPRRLRNKTRRRHSWKMRHHLDDDEKLPFPKHVVGTYSCHGIEPIYDSDYENGAQDVAETKDGDEDSDDFWGANEEEKEQKTSATAAAGGDAVEAVVAPEEEDEEVDMEPRPLPGGGKPLALAAAMNNTAPAPNTAISAKINQDRGGLCYPYANSRRTALFSVYDGHGQGGELVSQFALHEIQRRLEKHPSFSSDLEKAMRETFLAVDEALKHEPIIEPYFAGTTACIALLQGKKLTLANAGDSRAVLARKRDDGDWDGVDLTIDQNPDSPKEMERIVQAGGFVSPPPGPGLSARVWLDADMTQIGLAMARSIGDHAVADVGVIADPVVSTAEITDADDFMILASDGVWEFLSSADAVQIVGDHLEELGATKACQALIEAAASKWHEEEGEYRDDITAIVVRVHQLWGTKQKN